MEGKKKSPLAGWYMPFMGLFVLMLGLHMVMHMGASDDSVFINAPIGNLLAWLYGRWFSWSTRFVTDGAWMLLLKAPALWRVLDAAVYTAMAIALSQLLGTLKNAGMNLLLCLLLLLYPFADMSSAGWVTTTCVYLWTAAAVVFALLPVKRLLTKPHAKLSWWRWTLGLGAALYASSQEQACCALIALMALSLMYALSQKQFHPYYIAALGIASLMLAEHLLSPALAIRDVEEAAIWFPDFGTLGFFTKLELGFTSTVYHFVCAPDLVFTAFSVLLIGRLIRARQGGWIAVACLPLFFQLIYGYGLMAGAMEALFPALSAVGGAMSQYGTGPVWGDWDTFLPLLIMAGTVACLLLSLWRAFPDKKAAFLSIYVLGVGLAARWVLGFSPTVWGSGSRTFVLLYFGFVFVSGMLARQSFIEEARPWPKAALGGLGAVSLMQFLQTLLTANLIGQ